MRGFTLSRQDEQLQFLTDTVFAVGGKLVTLVAQTLEGADFIEAASVSAHLAKKRAALVDVCKAKRSQCFRRERVDAHRQKVHTAL